MKKILIVGVLGLFGAFSLGANAGVLVEDFEEAFPAWESGWLGTNSNLENWYGAGSTSRGNNDDGLWIDDGDGVRNRDIVVILFESSFAATLTSFAIDIAIYVEQITFEIFDLDGTNLLSEIVVPTRGAGTDPGVYENFSVVSSNGIGGFRFSGTSLIEGNTSIDNVVATTADVVSVPEPATLALLGLGLMGLGLSRRKTLAS